MSDIMRWLWAPGAGSTHRTQLQGGVLVVAPAVDGDLMVCWPSSAGTGGSYERVNRRSGTNHMIDTATYSAYEIHGLTKASPTPAASSPSDAYPLTSDPMASPQPTHDRSPG